MAILFALVNLVTTSLVAWVVGGNGGDHNGKGSEQFHFSKFFYFNLYSDFPAHKMTKTYCEIRIGMALYSGPE